MDVLGRLDRVEERLARIERVLAIPDVPPRVASRFDRPAAFTAPQPPVTAEHGSLFPERVQMEVPAALSTPASPIVAPVVPPGVPPVVAPISGPVRETPRVPLAPPPRLVREPVVRAAGRGADKTRSRADLERVLGVTVLGRVGVAALLLAAGYFAQLAYRGLSPTSRVALIYALSAAMVGVGAWLRPKVAAKYVAILWGGGIAVAYLAGVVAKIQYDLVDAPVAIALLAASCALGQVLAKFAKLPALAFTALAGAFAAPVIVGSPVDARTALLVYLVTLFAWGLLTEAKWGWRGMRLVATLGMSAVAGLWLFSHGAVDVSTYAHAHVYLAALVAPEIFAALRGRSVSRDWTGEVMVLVAFAEALAFFSSGGALPRFGVVAGGVWLALAVLARTRSADSTPMVRSMARLGGLLAVAGSAMVWSRLGWTRLDEMHGSLAALAALGLLSALSAGRLGAGGGAATLASVLAVGRLAIDATPHDPWTAAALVAPLALLFVGRHVAFRLAAMGLGAVAIFLGLAQTTGENFFDPAWLAAAFAAATLFVYAPRLRATIADDPLVGRAADAMLVVLAASWAAFAFNGVLEPVPSAIANPGTLAGLALAAGLAARRPWVRSAESSDPSHWLAGIGAALAALLALLGWREIHAAVAGLPTAAGRAACDTIYIAIVAAGGLVAARGTRSAGLHAAALVTLAVATAKAFADAAVPGANWSAAGVIAVLGGVAWLAARKPWTSPDATRNATALAALALAGLWACYALSGRLETAWNVANARVAAGLGVAMLLYLLRRRSVDGAPPPFAAVLAGAQAILLFLVGLAEVHDAVARLAADARAALETEYVAVASCVAMLVARRTRSQELFIGACVGLVAATFKAFLDARLPGGPWTAVAEMFALGGATWLATRTEPVGDRARVVIGTALGLALAALWCVLAAGHRLDGGVTCANPRILAGLGVTALLVLLRRSTARGAGHPEAVVLAVGASLLGFLVGLAEIHDLVAAIALAQWRSALVSVYATLYAAAILAIGFRAKAADLRYLALAGFAVVVGKVGLHDLAALDTPYRILITGVLGGVLLVAAYAYARRGKDVMP